MSTLDELDVVLERFFGEGPTEIDDAVIEASLHDIETIPQRRTGIGSRRNLPMSGTRLALAAAAIVVAVLAPIVLLRPFAGVGGGSSEPTGGASPTPLAAASATPVPSRSPAPSAPPSPEPSLAPSPTAYPARTTFTSPTYAYSVTLAKDWLVIPAGATWDGSSAPGFDDPSVDQWIAPHVQNRCATVFVCGPTLWAYSGPTSLDLAAWVAAEDAAANRDHPCGILTGRASIRIDGQPAVLESGPCAGGGPFLMAAYTVRAGTGYAFCLQDNTNEAKVEGLDRTDFAAVLATVRLGP